MPPDGDTYWHAKIVELRLRLVENAEPNELSENDVIAFTIFIDSSDSSLIGQRCSHLYTGTITWKTSRSYVIANPIKEKSGKCSTAIIYTDYL